MWRHVRRHRQVEKVSFTERLVGACLALTRAKLAYVDRNKHGEAGRRQFRRQIRAAGTVCRAKHDRRLGCDCYSTGKPRPRFRAESMRLCRE